MNLALSEPHRVLVQRLVKGREAAGLTQRDLAQRLGVDHSWVGKVETDRVGLNVIQVLKLAAALDLDPGELLAGLGEMIDVPLVAARASEPK